MQRTTGANATVDNKFQDADPGIGQKATSLTATWMNQVQEEISTPIEASGRTLDPSKTNQLMQSIIDLTYAIGDYIYTENDALTPGARFPWQTWVEVTGVVLVGRDTGQTEFNATGKTGGEKTHVLTISEMPAHSHTMFSDAGTDRPALTATGFAKSNGTDGTNDDEYSINGVDSPAPTLGNTGTTGSGDAHNNLQPYRVVRMWRRTA